MQKLEMEVEEEEQTSFLSNGNHSPRSRQKAGGSGSKLWLMAATIAGFLLLAMRVGHSKSQNDSLSDAPATPQSPPASPTVSASNNAPSPTDVAPNNNADGASSGSAISTSTTTMGTTTSTPKEKGPMLYSKMATIVPDPEHVPIDEETRTAAADKWGKWHFWDGDEEERPTGDYCGDYPNRDIPGDDFPDNAWQTDAVFVNHFLDDAEQLVQRTIEAILTEYGHGGPVEPEDLLERLKMYDWIKVDLSPEDAKVPDKYSRRANHGGGGWTTERSYDGLVRRLLHAIMTNDRFTVVLGGHSAAAGHGNHFRQSYMMQFHKIMAPIFARLGVKLVTRNLSQGGLGTIQNALGMKDLYGGEIDLLLWDSGMTEGSDSDIEFFLRQGLLSGNKVPVLWGGNFEVLRFLHEAVDADVGFFGNGFDGIPEVTSAAQAETLPYAARYLKCAKECADLCLKDRFCATCWIDRPDVSKSLFPNLKDKPGSQVKWHPGWRHHQLVGRVLALSVLDALQVAIQTFSDGTMGGPPLDDSFWHVTDYYKNIRDKLKNLDSQQGFCKELEPRLPGRVCSLGMKGRSLFTPRANPRETSLLSIIKPAPNGYSPQNANKVLYSGPDSHNQCYDVQPGEVDVLLVASGRRHLVEQTESIELEALQNETWEQSSRDLGGAIVPGTGWQHKDEYPGDCDGTYDSICGRHATLGCPLIGHHDSRGVLVGNEYSGWLVMEIPEVNDGMIIIKMHTWHKESDNTITEGWTSVNNERRGLRSHGLEEEFSETDYVDGIPEPDRYLGTYLDDLPDAFVFDYAVNGDITSLDKAAFIEKVQKVQRVVEVITLLDDPSFGRQEKVEVAIRLRGCGRQCTFGVTHLYWS